MYNKNIWKDKIRNIRSTGICSYFNRIDQRLGYRHIANRIIHIFTANVYKCLTATSYFQFSRKQGAARPKVTINYLLSNSDNKWMRYVFLLLSEPYQKNRVPFPQRNGGGEGNKTGGKLAIVDRLIAHTKSYRRLIVRRCWRRAVNGTTVSARCIFATRPSYIQR